MEERQHVQEHVAAAESPGRVQHPRVGVEVVVGEHRALGLAGGARGVEERREVVGLARHGVEGVGHRAARLDQGAVLSGAEGEGLADGVALAQPGDAVRRLRPRHHQPGLGVAEEVVELALGIRGVERQVDRARAQACEVEDERARRLLHLHRDAVAGRDAALAHQVRVAGRLGLDVGVGPRRAGRRFEAGGGAVGGEMCVKECVEVGVRHRSFRKAGWMERVPRRRNGSGQADRKEGTGHSTTETGPDCVLPHAPTRRPADQERSRPGRILGAHADDSAS